ncbi:hypothetical protein [Synechococcus sp. PCC 7336]|uniref:hypothetical protein n=1 Tax=Synechococcus sp. PCC 7336 TaxID=195250 RepID=UPI0004763F99|nr:hypothetical protein [Synechococcus sp. PCC 7336]
MPQSSPASYSGNIAINVIPQVNGSYICEATSLLDREAAQTNRFHGQSPKHAIAIALESMARTFRMEAVTEQNINALEVERSPSGEVKERRFHVILHYERVAEEESMFEAMLHTHLGNTIVEQAETSIIQVNPDLPIEPFKGVFIE